MELLQFTLKGINAVVVNSFVGDDVRSLKLSGSPVGFRDSSPRLLLSTNRRTMFNTSSVQPRCVTEISLNGLTRRNLSQTSAGNQMCQYQEPTHFDPFPVARRKLPDKQKTVTGDSSGAVSGVSLICFWISIALSFQFCDFRYQMLHLLLSGFLAARIGCDHLLIMSFESRCFLRVRLHQLRYHPCLFFVVHNLFWLY
jgi:hypothetical protein